MTIIITDPNQRKRDPEQVYEWESAAHLHKAYQRFSSRELASAQIISDALKGRLIVWAERFIRSNDPDNDFSDNCLVPSEVWWSKGGTALNQDWVLGNFSGYYFQTHGELIEFEIINTYFRTANHINSGYVTSAVNRSIALLENNNVFIKEKFHEIISKNEIQTKKSSSRSGGPPFNSQHFYAAAMIISELLDLDEESFSRTKATMVGEMLIRHYEMSPHHPPATDNLKKAGAAVRRAAEEVRNAKKSQ